jgi:hypothetical protein
MDGDQSPVQLGDYATVGRSVLSVVNADSFWVDAYFEETQLASIREGDPAKIKLMGYGEVIRGTVADRPPARGHSTGRRAHRYCPGRCGAKPSMRSETAGEPRRRGYKKPDLECIKI